MRFALLRAHMLPVPGALSGVHHPHGRAIPVLVCLRQGARNQLGEVHVHGPAAGQANLPVPNKHTPSGALRQVWTISTYPVPQSSGHAGSARGPLISILEVKQR